MNVKRFLRVAALGIIIVISLWILVANVHAKSGLWMLEISEETAMMYNQLCVRDEKGRLYSLAGWVPSPMHREKLKASGVDVEDYATIYQQMSYERVISPANAIVPIVSDDAQIIHYYSADESIVSFRTAEYLGYEDGVKVYKIDPDGETVFNATVGPDGYSTYDLSSLEDGLYYVNPGGFVELKRSK